MMDMMLLTEEEEDEEHNMMVETAEDETAKKEEGATLQDAENKAKSGGGDTTNNETSTTSTNERTADSAANVLDSVLVDGVNDEDTEAAKQQRELKVCHRWTVMPLRSQRTPKEHHRIVVVGGPHKGKSGTLCDVRYYLLWCIIIAY